MTTAIKKNPLKKQTSFELFDDFGLRENIVTVSVLIELPYSEMRQATLMARESGRVSDQLR